MGTSWLRLLDKWLSYKKAILWCPYLNNFWSPPHRCWLYRYYKKTFYLRQTLALYNHQWAWAKTLSTHCYFSSIFEPIPATPGDRIQVLSWHNIGSLISVFKWELFESNMVTTQMHVDSTAFTLRVSRNWVCHQPRKDHFLMDPLTHNNKIEP